MNQPVPYVRYLLDDCSFISSCAFCVHGSRLYFFNEYSRMIAFGITTCIELEMPCISVDLTSVCVYYTLYPQRIMTILTICEGVTLVDVSSECYKCYICITEPELRLYI